MIPYHQVIILFLSILETSSIFISKFNFTVDYVKFKKECRISNQKCIWEEPEITMRTIAKWPVECEYLCGILIFNENFDVPEWKLNATMGKLIFLYGGIRVINTDIKDLSILPKFGTFCDESELEVIITGKVFLDGAFIMNNSKLENADFILKSYEYLSDADKCIFQIANNPKLNTSSICKNGNFTKRIGIDREFQVVNNLADCGCQGILNFKSIDNFKNCDKVVGKLIITDNRDLIPDLSKLKLISGDLSVTNTTLKNLSFLENLEEIRSHTNFSFYRIVINIYDNKEMIRLGIGSLKKFKNAGEFGNWQGRLNMNFENLHSDFCLSVDEMIMLLKIDAKFLNIEASFCGDMIRSSDKPKLCQFENMANLEQNCVIIIGNLLIDSGDEDFLEKLGNVTFVFGTVTVQNTNLYNLKFFKKLERIANLNESRPIIELLSNKNLLNVDIPKLQILIARQNNTVTISDNHPDLFKKVKNCLKFQYQLQTNLSYNGKPCRAMESSLHGTKFDDDTDDIVNYDFNFDTDIDYSEGGMQSWYSLYDGEYDMTSELFGFTFGGEFVWYWKSVNDVAALVAFVINIFHLIALLQKELRTNFIYILMIGISICDMLFASTFIAEYLLSSGWIYELNDCGIRPKYHVIISQLEAPIQEATRKSSTFLAFFMALFRTCSVMFPTSNVLVTVSKPRWAVLLVLVVFSVQGSWDTTTFMLCQKKYKPDYTCHELYNEMSGYYAQCEQNEYENGDTETLKSMMQFDGHFTIFLAFLYLLVTAALLFQLRAARNRRKSLKNEQSQKTSWLVTVMAITFFFSEILYGLYFITFSYIRRHYDMLDELMTQGQVFLWSFVTINSTAHCFLCFFLSSQYRNAIRRVILRKDKEATSVSKAMKTITTVKVSTASIERF